MLFLMFTDDFVGVNTTHKLLFAGGFKIYAHAYFVNFAVILVVSTNYFAVFALWLFVLYLFILRTICCCYYYS